MTIIAAGEKDFRIKLGRWINLLAFGYAVFVIYVSILPLEGWLGWEEARGKIFLLKPIELQISSRSDWLGNVIFFVPLGLLLSIALGARLEVHGLIGYFIRLFSACLGALVVSFCAEGLQAFIPLRISSWGDVLSHLFGSLLGASLGALPFLAHLQALNPKAGELARRNPSLLILLAYLVGLVFIYFLPFDVVLSPADIYRRWKEGHIVLSFSAGHGWDRLEWLTLLVTQSALFIPLGFLIFTAAAREGFTRRQALWLSVALGSAVAAGLETGQIFVASRVASLMHAAIGAVGILAGVMLAPLFWQGREMGSSPGSSAKPRIQGEWLAFWLFCAAYLLFEKLRPFRFELDVEAVRAKLQNLALMPFYSYISGSSDIRLILDDLLREGLFFVPLGFSGYVFLSRLLSRRWPGLSLAGSMAVGLAAAVGGEVAQFFLPIRQPDTTDVWLGLAGTYLGAWAGRKLSI